MFAVYAGLYPASGSLFVHFSLFAFYLRSPPALCIRQDWRIGRRSLSLPSLSVHILRAIPSPALTLPLSPTNPLTLPLPCVLRRKLLSRGFPCGCIFPFCRAFLHNLLPSVLTVSVYWFISLLLASSTVRISFALRTSTSRAFPVPFIFFLSSSAGCHPAFGSAFGLFTCRWLLFEPCGFADWSARIVPLAASSFCISRAYLREPLHQAVYFSALPRRASLSSISPDAIRLFRVTG